MNRTIRRYLGAVLAVFPLILPPSPTWASGRDAELGNLHEQ